MNFATRILEMALEISRDTVGTPILRPITSAEYPLLAARPLNTATSKDKIKRVFDIEMPGWEDELRAYLNIEAHELFPYVTLIEGSSTAPEIVAKVKGMVQSGETVLVILE